MAEGGNNIVTRPKVQILVMVTTSFYVALTFVTPIKDDPFITNTAYQNFQSRQTILDKVTLMGNGSRKRQGKQSRRAWEGPRV